jgi:hypothetical protein
MHCTCPLLGGKADKNDGKLHLRLRRNEFLKISRPDWIGTGVNIRGIVGAAHVHEKKELV